MLTDEKDITARTTADDIAKFIKQAEKIAVGILEKSDKPFKLRLQFKCSPSGHELEIAVNPMVEEQKAKLQKLHEDLSKLGKLPVKEGTVEFQMFLEVNP